MFITVKVTLTKIINYFLNEEEVKYNNPDFPLTKSKSFLAATYVFTRYKLFVENALFKRVQAEKQFHEY